ncbi:MAG TPA: SdpA family antimicrobial peptide system protein [Polyangiaceae bacterium]|nr:SdpA family antimicrobial peptide system protein [Polyangiaceae bacterium]
MDDEVMLRKRRNVAGAALLGGGALVAAMCLLCLGTVLPPSALRLPKATGHAVSLFFPQGWKFFTKDPLSADFYVYRTQSDRSWVSITAPAMGSRENLWGIDRRIRTQGLELAKLLGESSKELNWSDCDDAIGRCAEGIAAGPVIHNHAPAPTVCGTIAVTQERPVPWSWRHLRSRMPFTIARARVECSNG